MGTRFGIQMVYSSSLCCLDFYWALHMVDVSDRFALSSLRMINNLLATGMSYQCAALSGFHIVWYSHTFAFTHDTFTRGWCLSMQRCTAVLFHISYIPHNHTNYDHVA